MSERDQLLELNSLSSVDALPSDVGIFAHSLSDQPETAWEPLAAHLQDVGERASTFAEPFALGPLGRAAGVLHDIGKASHDFQSYIRGRGPSPDHSGAGAREAGKLYPGFWGHALAFAIAGHHGGLADGQRLAERLSGAVPPYDRWREHAAAPAREALAACPAPRSGIGGRPFSEAFVIRMIFSALIDADFLATEAFYASRETPPRPTERGGFISVDTLAGRLAEHLQGMRRSDTPLNRLRSEVLDHARAKAKETPGLFTLTVPTGGGKTLTSLAFALEHARRHGLRRVVYVIPFTSIIEQTAEVFRGALERREDPQPSVLEHHASFDWEAALPRGAGAAEADAGEGRDGLAKLRRAAENWDAPVVVTTAVQFFESLFANRTSRCRKLHNLAKSVIVLDEAQTLPLPLLRPCLAALDELALNCGASVVLCTATQPAVRVQDGKLLGPENKQTGERPRHGLDIPADRELAPDPRRLYKSLRRVKVEVFAGEIADETIAARFRTATQMLCIVNSRAHARSLYDAISGLDGAIHLSTLMCPVHRVAVLESVRAALANGRAARVVSTSLIEAGVDISFPEVWRASTGLDSIAQAAGRCNRNGTLADEGRMGRVVVFAPADWKPPRQIALAQQAAARALSRTDDPLGLAAIGDYFGELYTRKDFSDLDSTEVEVGDVKVKGVLDAFRQFRFPFAAVAERFRLIDEITRPVAIPYDDRAKAALDRLAHAERPDRDDLRTLQLYTVGVPRGAYEAWVMTGTITAVRPDLGRVLMRFADKKHYRDATGVDVAHPAYRSAASNLF